MRKLLILILIFTVISVFAKEITLNYLIEKGLANSLDMKKENINLKSSEINLITSYLTLLPSASVSASKSYYNGEENLISAGFSLGESVSWNDGRYFSIKNAILNKKNSELNFHQNKRNFIYNIFSKYISILKAQKNLEILKDNIKIQKRVVAQTKMKFEGGLVDKLSYDRAKLSLLSMELDIKKAESNLDNLRYELFTYVGIEDSGEKLKDIDISFEKDFNNIEIKENNSIKINKNNFEMAKMSLLQQKLSLFPSLSVNFSYNYSSSYPYDFLRFDKYEESHSIGINFSYGIFDIPSKQLDYSLAKRKFHLTKLQLDKDIKDYKNTVKHLIDDLKQFQETLKIEKEKLDLSEKNYLIAKEKYKAGLLSLLEYDNNKIDFIRAKLDYNNSYYDYLMKIAYLDMTLSKKIFGKW